MSRLFQDFILLQKLLTLTYRLWGQHFKRAEGRLLRALMRWWRSLICVCMRGWPLNSRRGQGGQVGNRKQERGGGDSEPPRQGSSAPAVSCLDQGTPLPGAGYLAARGARPFVLCVSCSDLTWRLAVPSREPSPAREDSQEPGQDGSQREAASVSFDLCKACGVRANKTFSDDPVQVGVTQAYGAGGQTVPLAEACLVS